MEKPSDKTSPPAYPTTQLPQYGFGSEFTFSKLVDENPFLFRVYTPKSKSPFYDGSEPFFVAQKFNEAYNSDPQPLSTSKPRESIALASTYRDVAIHMDWTTRSSSPFISTSFSFVWSIWEALRRYQMNMKHDIEIAVIDARAVADQAVTALELLRQSKPKERHRNYWKWYRFALESQDVLVYGSIPGSAVLASMPLLSIIDKLPSYFVDPQKKDDKATVLDKMGWHSVSQRSPSYRQFCQDVSERFLLMPAELRVRDTTAQSVRLAVALLRPWFHKTVHDDFAMATTKLAELAFIVSQWPGQWWARDHGELEHVIQHSVVVLGEEIRERQKVQISQEVQRLEDVVLHLEGKMETMMEAWRAALQVSFPDDLLSDTARHSTIIGTLTPETLTAVTCTPEVVTRKLLPPEEEKEKEIVVPSVADIPTVPGVPDLPKVKSITMLETASCVVTGFLFGAFVVLCVLSTQRRTLANHLT